jgi:hypothetical protein
MTARDPEKAALVSSLKDQNRQLRSARDQLAHELSALHKSTRCVAAK